MAKVVVAMSGGVDSSLSAYLMKQAGHKVIGLFVKSWDELDEHGVCSTTQDFQDVQAVCHHLGIDYYGLDLTQEYQEQVFASFLEEYQQGYTPNPDILCNREIKFKALWERAKSFNVDLLATGHYCRVLEGPVLAKGLDPGKDQSYFLYTLRQEVLRQVVFPIGDLTKRQVRAWAQEIGLKTHDKKDSTGICFIGKKPFREFLSQYINSTLGLIRDFDTGRVVGTHQGLPFYTIGQRRGLEIGGPGEAWFVVGKRLTSNELLVAQGSEHPALFAPELTASQVHWISDPPQFPLRAEAKIRYRHPGATCLIDSIGQDCVKVFFDEPQRAITPRQSVVFYQGDLCLGGGMIDTSAGGLLLPLSS